MALSTARQSDTAHRTHRGMVVVVDDDDQLREALDELLTCAGYLVLAARDGGEALSRLRGIGTGVVAVVDLEMPGMDGRQLIAAMQADHELQRIPILVVTGSPGAVEGIARLLRKPFPPEALVASVEELLGR